MDIITIKVHLERRLGHDGQTGGVIEALRITEKAQDLGYKRIGLNNIPEITPRVGLSERSLKAGAAYLRHIIKEDARRNALRAY